MQSVKVLRGLSLVCFVTSSVLKIFAKLRWRINIWTYKTSPYVSIETNGRSDGRIDFFRLDPVTHFQSPAV